MTCHARLLSMIHRAAQHRPVQRSLQGMPTAVTLPAGAAGAAGRSCRQVLRDTEVREASAGETGP